MMSKNESSSKERLSPEDLKRVTESVERMLEDWLEDIEEEETENEGLPSN